MLTVSCLPTASKVIVHKWIVSHRTQPEYTVKTGEGIDSLRAYCDYLNEELNAWYWILDPE